MTHSIPRTISHSHYRLLGRIFNQEPPGDLSDLLGDVVFHELAVRRIDHSDTCQFSERFEPFDGGAPDVSACANCTVRAEITELGRRELARYRDVAVTVKCERVEAANAR